MQDRLSVEELQRLRVLRARVFGTYQVLRWMGAPPLRARRQTPPATLILWRLIRSLDSCIVGQDGPGRPPVAPLLRMLALRLRLAWHLAFASTPDSRFATLAVDRIAQIAADVQRCRGLTELPGVDRFLKVRQNELEDLLRELRCSAGLTARAAASPPPTRPLAPRPLSPRVVPQSS